MRTNAKVKSPAREAEVGATLGGVVAMGPTGAAGSEAAVALPEPVGRARKNARNAKVNWDAFDSQTYLEHNYTTLRGDDRFFIETMRDYFAQFELPDGATGIDVGAGANLYPAFAMLPFVKRVTLLDYSSANIRWLERQAHGRKGFDPNWDQFWEVFCSQPVYQAVGDVRSALNQKAEPRYGDLFKLSPDKSHDIGTMFFVAESISSSRAEFKQAISQFFGSLKPGAPFAAAFMENSAGYRVGNWSFPAVRVGPGYIHRRLASEQVEDLQLYRATASKYGALRKGYDGMVLVVGRVKS